MIIKVLQRCRAFFVKEEFIKKIVHSCTSLYGGYPTTGS